MKIYKYNIRNDMLPCDDISLMSSHGSRSFMIRHSRIYDKAQQNSTL